MSTSGFNGVRAAAAEQSRAAEDDDVPPPGSETPPTRVAPRVWRPLLRFDEVQVPPFPIDALPSWLRDFVQDVAAFSQVQPDMPAVLALAALSTASAGRFHINVRPDYAETMNLYVAAVMDSGDRKSGVFKACTQPLREVEAELLQLARPLIAGAAQKRKNLEARLKHLQAKIAMVLGYQHVCRRKGCGHTEQAKDRALRLCPKCQMKLWPKGLPRPMRFHNLRGTTATLLARAGVGLVVAQRILRHSDPRLTANIYSRVDLADLQAGIDRMGIPGGQASDG